MHGMETQTEVIDELRGLGYEADLWIADDGTLTGGHRSTGGEPLDLDLDQVTVARTARFEGASNPDDEAMVLAVDRDGRPFGLLDVPYGPDLSGPQADTVRRLVVERPTGPARD